MSRAQQLRNLRRILLLPLQVPVLLLAHLVPRRRGLWIFADMFGYRDNPRYLLEHIRRGRYPGITPVWFAQSRTEAAEARAHGCQAVWKRSPRGWLLQARAEVAVIGSGLGELNRPLVARTFIVQTWHGAPLKRLHRDFPRGVSVLTGTNPVAAFANAVMRRASERTWARSDLVLAQSELVATRFISAFGVDRSNVAVVGTPRADVIGANDLEAELESDRLRSEVLGPLAEAGPKVVLYAPTWRDGGSEAFLWEGLDTGRLDALLSTRNTVLVIRMHPLGDLEAVSRSGLTALSRVVVCPTDVDVNVLLRMTDCVITDYSGIAIDYSLLRRPILYLMPDIENYESSRGFYEPPSSWTEGAHCETWDALLDQLEGALDGDTARQAAGERLASSYFAFRDTDNCARAVAEISERLR